MTTPQDTLYRLAERIRHLTDLFECDEDGDNIFDTIKQIELQMQDIMCAQHRQENLMNLIVKLLGKDELRHATNTSISKTNELHKDESNHENN